jgi:hypothetical protein
MYPMRVIHDLRPSLPWTIYSLPIDKGDALDPAAYEHRFAVKWDEDNDVRIHAAVLDVYYRSPETVSNLYAVGERKGSLTIWAQTIPTVDQNAWAAASNGPAIQDAWAVEGINAIAETRRTGGVHQNIQMMGEDVVARRFPPDHDQLNWLINLFDLGPSGQRRAWS